VIPILVGIGPHIITFLRLGRYALSFIPINCLNPFGLSDLRCGFVVYGHYGGKFHHGSDYLVSIAPSGRKKRVSHCQFGESGVFDIW